MDEKKMAANLSLWGGVFMLAGVVLGAFGAHGLKGRLTDYQMDIYRTAVFYHLIHALGLFAVAWLKSTLNDTRLDLAGLLLMGGILIFSGSLYMLALSGPRWLGALTPFGGLAFIAGWFLVCLSTWSG